MSDWKDDELNKQCRHKDCLKVKPRTEFTKQSRSKDGLYSYCKECKAKMKKVDYEKHRDKRNATRRKYAKTENGKKKIKEQSDKYLSTEKGKGALAKYRHKYRQTEKYKESRRISRRENGEHSIKESIKRAKSKRAWNKDLLDDGERIEMRKLYKKSKDMGEDYHVDHIIPYSGILPNGDCVLGAHRLENLQILHKDDNLSKGNNISYEELEKFTEGVHYIFVPKDYHKNNSKYPHIGFDVM